jgi:hypothetical protein
MNSLLQALAINERQPIGPWDTSGLRPGPGQPPVSLRKFVTDLGSQHVLVFLEVRSPDLLAQVNSFDELLSVWSDQTADPTTLAALQNLLVTSGTGLIVYQSKDQRIIGIRGILSSLTNLGALRIEGAGDPKKDPKKEVNDALTNIGQGAGGAGAGIVALATASTAGVTGAAEFFIILGSFVVFAGAGLVLGAGIAALLAATAGAAEQTVPAPSSPPSDSGPGDSDLMSGYQVFGSVPDNMSMSPELVDAILEYVFGVGPLVPEPGQLPGAGDLIPGSNGEGGFPGGETGGGFGGSGDA